MFSLNQFCHPISWLDLRDGLRQLSEQSMKDDETGKIFFSFLLFGFVFFFFFHIQLQNTAEQSGLFCHLIREKCFEGSGVADAKGLQGWPPDLMKVQWSPRNSNLVCRLRSKTAGQLSLSVCIYVVCTWMPSLAGFHCDGGGQLTHRAVRRCCVLCGIS